MDGPDWTAACVVVLAVAVLAARRVVRHRAIRRAEDRYDNDWGGF